MHSVGHFPINEGGFDGYTLSSMPIISLTTVHTFLILSYISQ